MTDFYTKDAYDAQNSFMSDLIQSKRDLWIKTKIGHIHNFEEKLSENRWRSLILLYGYILISSNLVWGHSKTTLVILGPILTTYLPLVDIFTK